MELGTTIENIQIAEKKLNVTFHSQYINFLLLSNGILCPPYWQFFSVFDPANPRKSSRNNIVSANTSSRWEYMDTNLISIASDSSGNRLVFNKNNPEEILIWNHEKNQTKKWKRGYEHLIVLAEKRKQNIEKEIEKSLRKTED